MAAKSREERKRESLSMAWLRAPLCGFGAEEPEPREPVEVPKSARRPCPDMEGTYCTDGFLSIGVVRPWLDEFMLKLIPQVLEKRLGFSSSTLKHIVDVQKQRTESCSEFSWLDASERSSLDSTVRVRSLSWLEDSERALMPEKFESTIRPQVTLSGVPTLDLSSLNSTKSSELRRSQRNPSKDRRGSKDRRVSKDRKNSKGRNLGNASQEPAIICDVDKAVMESSYQALKERLFRKDAFMESLNTSRTLLDDQPLPSVRSSFSARSTGSTAPPAEGIFQRRPWRRLRPPSPESIQLAQPQIGQLAPASTPMDIDGGDARFQTHFLLAVCSTTSSSSKSLPGGRLWTKAQESRQKRTTSAGPVLERDPVRRSASPENFGTTLSSGPPTPRGGAAKIRLKARGSNLWRASIAKTCAQHNLMAAYSMPDEAYADYLDRQGHDGGASSAEMDAPAQIILEDAIQEELQCIVSSVFQEVIISELQRDRAVKPLPDASKILHIIHSQILKQQLNQLKGIVSAKILAKNLNQKAKEAVRHKQAREALQRGTAKAFQKRSMKLTASLRVVSKDKPEVATEAGITDPGEVVTDPASQELQGTANEAVTDPASQEPQATADEDSRKVSKASNESASSETASKFLGNLGDRKSLERLSIAKTSAQQMVAYSVPSLASDEAYDAYMKRPTKEFVEEEPAPNIVPYEGMWDSAVETTICAAEDERKLLLCHANTGVLELELETEVMKELDSIGKSSKSLEELREEKRSRTKDKERSRSKEQEEEAAKGATQDTPKAKIQLRVKEASTAANVVNLLQDKS